LNTHLISAFDSLYKKTFANNEMNTSSSTTSSTTHHDEWTELARVRDLWTTIDLVHRKETLDKQGLEIAEQREKSSNARKNLATQTKSIYLVFLLEFDTDPV
jgi:hypothetical protein